MASPLSPHPLTIKTTILTGEPSTFTFTGDTQNTERRVAYDVGFALVVLLFIIILTYTSYMCNRMTRSRSPPPPTTSIHSTLDSDTDDFHSFSLSTGLEDDVLSNFPTCVYSELLKAHKVDTNVDTNHDHVINIESECSICLSDYESFDVLRLLPECGHLFHVSCIDRWLKIHATCPVCRKSPLHEK